MSRRCGQKRTYQGPCWRLCADVGRRSVPGFRKAVTRWSLFIAAALCAPGNREIRADAGFTMNGNARLPVSPALRRELIISCGAALYNLRLAIRVTGHDLAAWLLPGDSGPQVLASVEIVTGRTKRPTATEQELYEAIPRRHTNRWPYDDRHPVPPPILVAMQ